MVAKVKRRNSIAHISSRRNSDSLILKRHFTDDDKSVAEYQRQETTVKAILTGNFAQIEDRDVAHLLRAWAQRGGTTQIPVLVYEDIRFTTEDAKKLAKVMKENTPANIRALRLVRNALGLDVARTLLKALAGNRTIREIVVTNNNLGDKECKYIARLLHRNPCLVSIDLSANSIGPDGAILIANALKENDRLQHLFLQGNRIGSKGAVAFAEMLDWNRSLRHIDLGLNKLETEGASVLSFALRKNRGLDSIALDLNEIGFEGSLALSDSLRVNKYLTQIRMPRNNIGDKGVVWLCSGLLDNRQVRHLDLEGNSIGSSRDNTGAEAIARLLHANSTLRVLNLASNPLGDDGIRLIAEALRDNASLERLFLSSCNIALDGISALAESLPHNTRLQQLSLGENFQLGPEGHRLLAIALKRNHTLKGLHLDFNHDGWEPSYNSIQHSLTRNHFLQRGRYGAACTVLRIARILLNGWAFRPHPCSVFHNPRALQAKNITSFPYEVLERILFMTDNAGVLTVSEVRHIARFSTRMETLTRRLTKPTFLEITLGAYFDEGDSESERVLPPLGGGMRVRFAA